MSDVAYADLETASTTAGPDLATILGWLGERRGGAGRLLQTMREVKDTYNAEIAIPMPEMYPQEEAAVVNLLHMGLDGNAQRIASTMPVVTFPSVREGFKVWDHQAQTRQQWMRGVWRMNRMPKIMYRRARHLIGYATSPVMIRPDPWRGIPEWHVRDPMNCYPAPSNRLDDMTPSDVIFTFTRTAKWLRHRYPQAMGRLDPNNRLDPNEECECLEYVDAEVIVMAVLGRSAGPGVSPTMASQAGAYRDSQGLTGRQRFAVTGGGSFGTFAEELERHVNRAGLCTAVVPGRITLDRLQGQFDSMIGKYIRQARLDALELRAIEEGIYPRVWLVGRHGEIPQVIRPANGRKGIVGKVSGGEIIVQRLDPGYKTYEASDRLASAQRQEGGVPAEFGGLSPTNIRTGRRGDQVLASQIDFPIQEHQVILEESLEWENIIAVEVRKGWFGSRSASFYVNWDGTADHEDIKRGEFEKIFHTSRNEVKYSMAGADLNGQIVRVGQKLGTGIWSTQTAREQDPETENPELEHQRTILEGLERSLLAGIEDEIRAHAISPADVARLMIAAKTRPADEFPDAYIKVHEQAQVRQSSTVDPALPGSPETMPGMAAPGAGEEAGQVIPPPAPSLVDLNARLGQLARVRGALNAAAPG